MSNATHTTSQANREEADLGMEMQEWISDTITEHTLDAPIGIKTADLVVMLVKAISYGTTLVENQAGVVYELHETFKDHPSWDCVREIELTKPFYLVGSHGQYTLRRRIRSSNATPENTNGPTGASKTTGDGTTAGNASEQEQPESSSVTS